MTVLNIPIKTKEDNVLRLKELREQANITQVELAEMLNINQSAVASWETNRTMPRAKTLIRLAEILNCKIDDLCGA